jgi:hypothetical protein
MANNGRMGQIMGLAVEVSDGEDIGGTANWVATIANRDLALLLNGSGESSEGESEDDGVKHGEGYWWWR